MTLLTAIYFIQDVNFFESKGLWVIESGTEILFLFICIFFQQFLDARNSKAANLAIEWCFFLIILVEGLLSYVYLVKTVV